MTSTFLCYIKNTYPKRKTYALAALQDAASMLENNDELTQQQLASYFQIAPQAWQALRQLLLDQEDQAPRCIRVCTGPVCQNKGSMKIILETNIYIKKFNAEYVLKKMHCQGQCNQAPIVTVDDHIFAECRVESIFSHIN